MQLGEGLYVMVFGMGLVFLTLVLLMFAIMGLDRVFRLKVPGEDAAEAPPSDAPAPVEELTPTATTGYLPGSSRGQVVAAIALALARAQAHSLPRTSWASRLAAPSDDDASDWIWEEGIDDYGVVEGSQYA